MVAVDDEADGLRQPFPRPGLAEDRVLGVDTLPPLPPEVFLELRPVLTQVMEQARPECERRETVVSRTDTSREFLGPPGDAEQVRDQAVL